MTLFGTDNAYCMAVDKIVAESIQRINYGYSDMPMDRDTETFNYYFSKFSDDTFEKILSIQDIDSSCGSRIFEKNRILDAIIEKNYAKNMDRIGACNVLNINYPDHQSKFTENTLLFPRILRRNNLNKIDITITKNKTNPDTSTINANLNFTDGKTCMFFVKESDLQRSDSSLYTCLCS